MAGIEDNRDVGAARNPAEATQGPLHVLEGRVRKQCDGKSQALEGLGHIARVIARIAQEWDMAIAAVSDHQRHALAGPCFGSQQEEPDQD